MDARLFDSLEWRLVGPFKGGRVVAVAGHPTERATFYFGACAGGVWKTTDGGEYWRNISDGFFNVAAVGAIAVAESDPNVIYVGTGETAIRGNVSHGDGVYKSTDGGRSWKNVGLADTRHIGDIQVHPSNPDVVYVAALGHAWGPNEERGVFRSTDGGASWEKVLYKNERAGSIDISMDPKNPRVIYATIWQAQRFPHKLESGGPDSGIWKTTDGGDTWQELTHNPGLPAGVLGKVGIAASPAQSGRVYAIVEAEDGALFRSDDGGATWQRLSEDGDLRRRAWYYHHIYADPSDADTVWVLNQKCKKSIDGGKTFFEVPTPHGDNHDLWIDPRDSNRLIEGNDGGANVSYNGGLSWSSILNQPTSQFYHVTTDNAEPYWLYGSQQDNTAVTLPSMSFDGAITRQEWVEPGGGESGYIAIQPEAPGLVFAGGIGSGLGHGRLLAWNPRTRQTRNVTVWPDTHGMGEGAITHKYRFQWTFPIELSPHDPKALYITGNHVFRSMDNGTSWETLSPDLTRNDQEKLQASGGPITRDNTGAEAYCTIFAFRESPLEAGVFWAGTDDGLLWISRDNAANWQNITPSADILPEWALISIIEPSPHDPASAYVAATRYKHDDTRPYLLKTNDYGASWQLITNGMPESEFTRVIREDPNRRGLLYAGTETGIYISFDDGASWQRFQSNLPVAPVHDLIIKGKDLVVATHGRSFWILDDLSPVHQMRDEIIAKAAHLYQPGDAKRYRIYFGYGNAPTSEFLNYRFTGPGLTTYRQVSTPDGTAEQHNVDAGTNPPNGVVIHYWLANEPQGAFKLTILDADGAEVNSYSSDADPKAPAKAGANRFVWDMLGQGPTPEDKPTAGEDDFFDTIFAKALAPKALPGSYQVRLEVDGQTLTERFAIAEDPRKPCSLEDLQAQFELKTQIRDAVSQLHETLNKLRATRAAVNDWTERINASGEVREVSDAALAINTKLESIENELVQLKADSPLCFPAQLKDKLTALAFMVDEADAAPTQGSYQVFAELRTKLDVQRDTFARVQAEDVAAFNRTIAERGTPAVVA